MDAVAVMVAAAIRVRIEEGVHDVSEVSGSSRV